MENKELFRLVEFVLLSISAIAACVTVSISFQSLLISQKSLEYYTNPKPILETNLYYGLNMMPENPTIDGTIFFLNPQQLQFNVSIANRGNGKSIFVVNPECTGNFIFGINEPYPHYINCSENQITLGLGSNELDVNQRFDRTLYVKPNTNNLEVGDVIKGNITIRIFEQATRTWFSKFLKINLIVTNESQSGTSAI